MYTAHSHKRKSFAAFFLFLLSFQTFYPCVAYAVTSGPAQPEMQSFQAAGTNDMVDLFSGDFKYNIPLLDVGGYPVNLAYQSGTGIEDEATWVGTGWTLNPGAVNRNMRGLPDDFNGEKGDRIQKSYYRKEFKKVGGKVILKGSLFAHEVGTGSISMNIYKDNYYGIGASLGASLGFTLGKNTGGPLTAGLGLDLNSDIRDGASITPNISLTGTAQTKSNENSGSISGSFTYNTRAGLKSVDLGLSFSSTYRGLNGKGSADISNSAVHYFGQTYCPTIENNINNDQKSLNFDLGPSGWGAYGGIGGGGYYYHEAIQDNEVSVPAYGYLNYTSGRNKTNFLLDFNREKDGVYIPGIPSIAVPVATQDYFVATGQSGSHQFRPYYGGNYVVFDKPHTNKSAQAGLGLTAGWGNIFKAGARIDVTNGQTETKKWKDGNQYLTMAEAQFDNTPAQEPVYFKEVGERSQIDQPYYNLIKANTTQKVALTGAGSTNASYITRASNTPVPVTANMKRLQRDIRNNNFSYLSAEMAARYGLDRKIYDYTYGSLTTLPTITPINRADISLRRSHHISEITVTGNDGQRMIYGIPVYNKKQVDATFSISAPTGSDKENSRRSGLIQYSDTDASSGNVNGRDRLYTKEETPGYATSYLLTGVLSTDYVDATGDGITDDDPGTAVKFNYSKVTDSYKWRAPYALNTANYNEGYLSDPKDDKASYSYGEKEIWNLASIESKTMIAIFRTSDREDGLGVVGETGGKNTTIRLKKLDKIELYTKADWLAGIQSGIAPTPIKVVHFQYDYSLYPGVPNNVNAGGGKLTLKKLYFTFGTSSRGTTNPYEFSYDVSPVNKAGDGITAPPATNPTYTAESADQYTPRQSDRWGTYKQSWYTNRAAGSGPGFPARSMNNSEFPYALQKNEPPPGVSQTSWAGLIDRMASKWQLNTITTPAGSKIIVVYENDDYAYVQNRRAMQMCLLNGIGTEGTNTGLPLSDDICINLPVAVSTTAEFKQKYLEGQDKIFYKIFTDIDGRGHWEYVHGYASVDLNNCRISAENVSTHTGIIRLKKLNGYNPIAKGAWQTLKSDLPQFAYDNYDNSDVGDGAAAIKSIITSFTNLREFFLPFDTHARNSGFAGSVDLSKSMIRLCCPDRKKTGGGSRVKSLIISDEWATMTQGQTTGTVKTATYGQTYDYTIKDAQSGIISSGVASYEPQIGNEENPFHEPVNYTEKVYWSSDRNHFVEKPYCESYFPAAGVGYSKVTVTSIGNNSENETGYIDNEFYTAKDFPTLVDNLTLDQNQYQNSLIVQLFASTSIKKVAVSQGFKIELNDMHGKPKSVKVHNKGGDIISQTDYSYNVKDDNAEVKDLYNTVDVLQKDGQITSATIGTDVDMVTDVRESTSDQTGTSAGVYGGAFIGFIVPIPFFGINYNQSVTASAFRSVCAVKVIHRFGILKTVRTMQNGSTLTAENLLWDGQTGEVLLTKNQNEFDDYTYAFTYPAYMAYDGMGEAYKNLGAVLPGFSSNAATGISSGYNSYLVPGDELISLTSNQKGWVIKSGDGILRFIDDKGDFINISGTFMVARSGRRNLLSASAGTVVLMKDPRESGVLNLGVDRRVLDAKAVLYNDQWSMPVDYCPACPDGYHLQNDGSCAPDTIAAYGPPGYQICAAQPYYAYSACGSYIYSYNDSNMTAFRRTKVSASNSFWIGTPTAQAQQCNYTPAISSGGYIASRNGGSGQSGTAQKQEPATSSVNGSLYDTLDNESASRSVTNSSASSSLVAPPALAGPLNRCGIWTCPTGNNSPVGKWIGLTRHITVPTTKIYYVGIGADDRFRLKVDGRLVAKREIEDGENYRIWHIYRVELTSGSHILELDGWNSGGPASFGAEIYNNTAAEIAAATDYTQLNLVFSTKDLIGQYFQTGVYSCPTGYALNTATVPYTCVTTIPAVTGNNPYKKINPYANNILGNWRPQTNFVYTVNRNQTPGLTTQNGGTDTRRNGFYSLYNSFWQFTASGLQNAQFVQGPGTFDIPASADKRWVWANQAIYFDQKSNEVESRDALNRYGSALYGYNQTIAVAIGANARHNEIAFDGFEDYNFNLGSTAVCPFKRQLNWNFTKNGTTWSNASGAISTEMAHTGRYSYKLTANTSVSGTAGAANPTAPFLGWDAAGHYQLLQNEQGTGFSPVPNKKYVLSMWVNEDGTVTPTSNKVTKLAISINGTAIPLSTTPAYVVEGWKRIDVVFTTPPNTTGTNFQLSLTPTGTVYLDDLRVLPFDGQMGSYVYDAVTMRLVAQLDENNFATFYEYNEEGTPVRVKKETEKGIVTLKENRQSFRKR